MDFHKSNNSSSDPRSYDNIDHLTYLKKAPSIFETKDALKMKQTNLTCARCGQPVTRVSEKVEIFGRHDHAFHLYDEIIQLGCFRNAPGCMGVQGISNGYSWFRGYSWQIQVCNKCYIQLGWKYMSENESFYGLMFRMLREEDLKKDDET